MNPEVAPQTGVEFKAKTESEFTEAKSLHEVVERPKTQTEITQLQTELEAAATQTIADLETRLGTFGVPPLSDETRAQIRAHEVDDAVALEQARAERLGARELNEGLEHDPRLESIKKELVAEWQKTTGKDMLSGDGQDYLFGDPSAWQRGERPVPFMQRAKEVFAQRFPEDAKAYEQNETKRIYTDPQQDPLVKQLEEQITAAVNKSVNEARSGKWGRIATREVNESGFWDRMRMSESGGRWAGFAALYPEKAAAYANTIPELKGVLDRQSRWQHAQTQAYEQTSVPAPEAATTIESREIVADRMRLKELPYLKSDVLNDGFEPSGEVETLTVNNQEIVGSVQASFTDWSGNPDERDERNALIETIAHDFIKDAKNGNAETGPSIERAFGAGTNFPVVLARIEGPQGPVFIAKDGSHRIAASKLAELPKVPAKVESWRERKTMTTQSSTRASEWNKLIERGLVKGSVQPTETGGFVLTIEKQALPWAATSLADFVKTNDAYEHVHPGAFKDIKSLKDGKPIPEAVFLDKTGFLLTLFLYRPAEFETQMELKEKQKIPT